MLSAETVSLVLLLLKEAPSLYQTAVDDINLLKGGGMSAADFEAKWTQMNADWEAVKAKWAAAGQA